VSGWGLSGRTPKPLQSDEVPTATVTATAADKVVIVLLLLVVETVIVTGRGVFGVDFVEVVNVVGVFSFCFVGFHSWISGQLCPVNNQSIKR
jgi:hypothetical protein